MDTNRNFRDEMPGSQDYPTELLDWMGSEHHRHLRDTPTREGWHEQIVDQATDGLRQRHTPRIPPMSITFYAISAFVANGLPFFALAAVLALWPHLVTPLVVVLVGIATSLADIGAYLLTRRLQRGR
jgi:hypothetical protein